MFEQLNLKPCLTSTHKQLLYLTIAKVAVSARVPSHLYWSYMEGYGAIRHEYEHLVEFLVVDATSPKGQAFIRSSQALIGSAVYYSADGRKITAVHGPQDTEFLLDSIKNAFNL